jgi:acyl carrier protein
MSEMIDELIEYVTDEYVEEDDDDVEVTATTPLITGGLVDSFSMVSLKRFIEQKWSVTIPDAEATAEAFDTIESIVALIRKHQ